MLSTPSTSLERGYIMSAFALPFILCLKVLIEINLPCHFVYIQLFLLSGKLEMISIDVIGISTLYLYILEEK